MSPHWMKETLSAALDLLYPPIHPCPQCGKEDVPLNPATVSLCPACFAGFPHMDEKDLPAGVHVPARYQGSAQALIQHLKYREAQYLAPAMASLMGSCVREQVLKPKENPEPGGPWVVVSVPLHRQREKERGYNQSQLLARALADMLEFSYEPKALIRHRKTAPLYRLSRQERARTLAGSMRLNPSVAAALQHRQILLVDDIYTTGATVNACMEALQEAAPAGITVTAFALAELQEHRAP